MTNTLKENCIWPPPKRLAEAVKNESRKSIEPPCTLDIYTLPMKAQPMKLVGCKCFIFGKDLFKRNRTIMVLGETGVGKSTLANTMINYILGVTWDDTFRFKLVDEGTAKSQTLSQTSEVTVYKLNHREGFQIDYSLTIVDTPGFGDTGGIEKDRMIIDQLQRLFSAQNGVSEIDAICLVAQANQVRLTPTQKYIFDSLLSKFGKDVAENIQILVTFAETVKEKQTFKELHEKYGMDLKKTMTVADIIKIKEKEYVVLHEEVVRLIERSAQCLNTLREIALKPDPLSTTEYIDLLIEGEKSEAKPGYLERIKELGVLKRKLHYQEEGC
ncbi:unnamed protein product [Boreogadus saida]